MTRKELKECLAADRMQTLGNTKIYHILYIFFTRHPAWLRWKYIKYMRLTNYHVGVMMLWYQFLKNRVGNKIGFEIGGKGIGSGFAVYHNGPVVIHGKAVLGVNCRLHGDNCIGNDGITDECPIIGDNVDIGVGAKIIGNVRIADNCIIGAGAVVTKDFLEPGSVIGGVPSYKLK